MQEQNQHSISIEKRNYDFFKQEASMEDSKKEHEFTWQGSTGTSLFLDAFSGFLPVGERFFIKTVRQYQDQIKDPKLQEDVKKFIFQEARHSSQHKKLNEHIKKRNPNIRFIDKFTNLMLFTIANKIYSKRYQLAITCAIEHLTAEFGKIILQEPLPKNLDNTYGLVWYWHAIEEVEHKSVAFDVYQTVTPVHFWGYLLRILTMFFTTTLFFLPLILISASKKLISLFTYIKERILLKKPLITEKKAKLKSGRMLDFFKTNIDLTFLKGYFRYYQYNFHPWDEDNSELLKQRLKELNELLKNNPHLVDTPISTNSNTRENDE
jgi:predicted metal-dependent hydrolase